MKRLPALAAVVLLGASAGVLGAPPKSGPNAVVGRFWRGTVRLVAETGPPPGGRGGETQNETLELVLVTEESPKAPKGSLLLRHRGVRGRWKIQLDSREPGSRDGDNVVTKGAGSGRFHGQAGGLWSPKDGRYKVVLKLQPRRMKLPVTLSGVDLGAFRTSRRFWMRRLLLDGVALEGRVQEGWMRGERRYALGSAAAKRRVVLRWDLERVEPRLRGRVSAGGLPLVGVEIRASHTTRERARRKLPPFLRQGRTSTGGRFDVEALFGSWRVRVLGAVVAVDGRRVVVAPKIVSPDPVLRIDEVPDLEIEVEAFWLDRLPRRRLVKGFQNDLGSFVAHLRAQAPRALAAARVRAPVTPPRD